MDPALERFSPATREWFAGAFPAPTPAQTGAWQAISSGRHALVVAPTGSGKTLSAFLWSLDRLAAEPRVSTGSTTGSRQARSPGTRVLYISPLKALGVDVERNLRSPLVGITQTAKRLGIDVPPISVGVRSGDTTSADRRLLLRDPPDILIIDAFSSDAIPLHLLTSEAIGIYARAMKPGGILLVHISNRFFGLEPVLAAEATENSSKSEGASGLMLVTDTAPILMSIDSYPSEIGRAHV